MITSRPTTIEDVLAILNDPSEVTESEMGSAFAGRDIEPIMRELLCIGRADTISNDDERMFILGHFPECGARRTWCIMSKHTDSCGLETMLAVRGAVERVLQEHPTDTFVSVSSSKHPKRDRFFAVLGFHKIGESDGFATFVLTPRAGVIAH